MEKTHLACLWPEWLFVTLCSLEATQSSSSTYLHIFGTPHHDCITAITDIIFISSATWTKNRFVVVQMPPSLSTTSLFPENSTCHDLHLIKRAAEMKVPSCARPFDKLGSSWKRRGGGGGEKKNNLAIHFSKNLFWKQLITINQRASLKRFQIFAEVPPCS